MARGRGYQPKPQSLTTEMNTDRFATWPNVPFPTLNGKTPLQAMKTFFGRERVEALITDFERTQEDGRSTAPDYDFNLLREAIGLPRHEPPKPRRALGGSDDAH